MNFPAAKSITLSRAHEHRRTDDLETQLADAAGFARKYAIAAIWAAQAGHPGRALSCADILACLYGAELNVWPSSLADPDRDRFVLSNAGAAPAFYAIAAHYGFCAPHEVLTFGKLGSPFQPHPHARDLSFVEASTASAGQGFSQAMGMAMGLKLQRRPARVYALLGEDEVQEGQVWETAVCASYHGLDNLCAIIDCSTHRDGVGRIPRIEPLASKWRACDWAVIEINGHDIAQILAAFRRTGSVHGRPALIIAHTVSGKGVPSWEGAPRWKRNSKLSHQQAEEALNALGAGPKDVMELLNA
jgi:transketolase